NSHEAQVGAAADATTGDEIVGIAVFKDDLVEVIAEEVEGGIDMNHVGVDVDIGKDEEEGGEREQLRGIAKGDGEEGDQVAHNVAHDLVVSDVDGGDLALARAEALSAEEEIGGGEQAEEGDTEVEDGDEGALAKDEHGKDEGKGGVGAEEEDGACQFGRH